MRRQLLMLMMIWFIVYRKDGMTSPVIVKKLPDGQFELIAGQRRLQAHKILNKSTISARYATRDPR